ncbi:5-oxoprolinase subunit PxpB [Polaribacter porphyrae]|uniref:Allophanate hydrolase n=1 Tax=Polaribacter porphyrae TaxID=1137780 RepID=A0A2S7WSN9_9FLAO|nr:5-oxoprolinase subunit PxpB [Polaribacter porphyrae]PQJ80609.1 allophanate hydrolase [Polaribacter porphyrae]
MSNKNLTYKKFGEKAILIEWHPIISDEILNDILLFEEKIRFKKNIEFYDLIQGYNSLTIIYKNFITDFEKEVQLLKIIYTSLLEVKKQNYYQWEIPVCYDLEFGIDLEEISQKSNLQIHEIVKLHTKSIYKIFFIGFLPGFLYLGGLSKKLFFDRKPNPRLNVQKGSVAIGGKQTGVYPNNSAGGWNIIGKTPINFFDVEKQHPCFVKAGDSIKFNSISLDEFRCIATEIKEKKYQLFKTLLNA